VCHTSKPDEHHNVSLQANPFGFAGNGVTLQESLEVVKDAS